MGSTRNLRCPRCGRTYPPASSTFQGCPTCRTEGVGVNLVCEIDLDEGSARKSVVATEGDRGLWRYSPLLPISPEFGVSLGEGDTPLVGLKNLGHRWGLSRLHVKTEGQNPTWSHKDRLCAVGTAAARWLGASVVTASSTGNHGASVAAYAARAGLGCVIFTVASVPSTMKTLMQSYGAEVVACRTIEDRYTVMAACVDSFGWYPLTNGVHPPIGSSPYGVDGYKSIAYELWKELGGEVPDWVVVPVAYGDCLSGIWRGFKDLKLLGFTDKLPRLVGAEAFGPLGQALEDPGKGFGPVPTRRTNAFSIGGGYTTFQAVAAVRESAGLAASSSEDEMMHAQLELGANEGIYAEAASTLGLAVVRRLRDGGTIGSDDLVVSILTSSGLKDPAATAELLPEVAVIDPEIGALRENLVRRWRDAPDGISSRERQFFTPRRAAT